MSELSTRAFKDAMGQFASGVTIVTMHAEGALHGLTVSAFTSVSAEPPQVLVCISKRQHGHRILDAGGVFAVNILSAEQLSLGGRFAVAPAAERFKGLDYLTAATGAPIIRGSLAWLDCRVRDKYDSGDHGIFIGDVLAVDVAPGGEQPLVYYNRNWRRLLPGPLSLGESP